MRGRRLAQARDEAAAHLACVLHCLGKVFEFYLSADKLDPILIQQYFSFLKR